MEGATLAIRKPGVIQTSQHTDINELNRKEAKEKAV